MYAIIQKIYEENKKVLQEGLKKVLNGDDISTLTGAIKDFTDTLGKTLLSEIVTQIENLVFDDAKRKNQYETVRFVDISATTVMRNVRKNEWKMEIEERPEDKKIKSKYIYIQVDEDHVKERNKKIGDDMRYEGNHID